MRSALISLLSAIPALAGTVTMGDGEFLDSNWSNALLSSNNASITMSRTASGGNPGAYRETTINFGLTQPGNEGGANMAAFSSLVTFDPSTGGAITQLDIRYDVSRIAITNVTFIVAAFYRPMLLQNGRIYFLNAVADRADAAFTSFSHTSLNPSDWGEINGGVTLPDFSTAGSLIQFGYRATQGGLCPGPTPCGNGSTVSGLDNFQVVVTTADPTAGVPEPGTLGALTLAAGVLGIVRSRQTGRR